MSVHLQVCLSYAEKYSNWLSAPFSISAQQNLMQENVHLLYCHCCSCFSSLNVMIISDVNVKKDEVPVLNKRPVSKKQHP